MCSAAQIKSLGRRNRGEDQRLVSDVGDGNVLRGAQRVDVLRTEIVSVGYRARNQRESFVSVIDCRHISRRVHHQFSRKTAWNRNGGDDAASVDSSDDKIVIIRNEELPGGTHIYENGKGQLGASCRPAVPAVAFVPYSKIARNSCDRPRQVHLSDKIVAAIRDEQISGRVQAHPVRSVQFRARRLSAITAVTGGRPRDGGDDAPQIHLADSVVVRVGDIEIARCVQRDSVGIV